MIKVPIRTVPGLNAREHWRARAKRVKAERESTRFQLLGRPLPPIPLTVRLTRVAPSNGVDSDNLSGELKAVRDEVAVWLGIDDRHEHIVRYVYSQRRGPWGVEIEWGEPISGIEFEPLEAENA